MKRFALLLVALAASGVFAATVLADTVLADTPPVTTTTTTDTTPTTTTTPAQVVPTGVTIAGVPVGDLAPEDAVAAVQQAFGLPVVLHFQTTTISIAPALLGLRVPADTAVARALTVAPGTSLALRAGYDRALVKAFVAKLAKRFDRKPVSSRLLFRASKPYVTKPVLGRTVDQAGAVKSIVTQLVHATRGTIPLKAKLRQPPVTPKTIGPVIVIRRGSNRLTLYDGMKVVRTFSVATGQNIYPTPLGRFQIVVKWKDPWWYPPASSWAKGLKPVPPGPNNPLGTRWMGLSSPGVGIHGTDEPASIGYSLSHGCIRMLVPQAEWLFDHVDVGTPVYIVPT
ncbi:MAG TPA: L,D-transpeptidase family protein [Gaiellaceae bacterium]|nr:L,D-transpeptidase family protein [Gaiellaceae bacterium]